MPNIVLHVTEAGILQTHVSKRVQVNCYRKGALHHILLLFFDVITSENQNAYSQLHYLQLTFGFQPENT